VFHNVTVLVRRSTLDACSPNPHMRSPARMEKDCSHAGPRRDGGDSVRNSVPPGRALRSDPSDDTVISSDSLRSTQGPSARKASMGWAWTAGAGPDRSPAMA
jgi:hypothetical protein